MISKVKMDIFFECQQEWGKELFMSSELMNIEKKERTEKVPVRDLRNFVLADILVLLKQGDVL